jgi:glycosyltransferase involved in cell wall biosynthesis
MASREPFSAVIITLNAGAQLASCLQSVAFADEIVVVDCGSDDDTVALAQKHGARVVHQDWLGYGAQKQFAITQARHDWVLCVDADERVSTPLRASIEAALTLPVARGFEMPRCNRFLGRWLKHGEGYPDWSLRLFRRSHGRWSEDRVHEKVVLDGVAARLRGDLMHESGEDLAAYLDKQNRYTTLQAEALFKQGKRARAAQLVLSPWLRFIKFYVLRLGFLDGVAGFTHIAIGCHNSLMKYAKLMALEKGRRN